MRAIDKIKGDAKKRCCLNCKFNNVFRKVHYCEYSGKLILDMNLESNRDNCKKYINVEVQLDY